MPDERARPRLSEIVASYLEAVERGEKPERESLLARHPKFQKKLRAFFEDYDRMERFAEPIRDLAWIGPVPRRLGNYEILGAIAGGGFAYRKYKRG